MHRVVSIIRDASGEYPGSAYDFCPSEKYPEYPFPNDDISELKNHVYESVRLSIYMLGLDKENYGTKNWNPFGEFISEGDTILIKPNLVKDVNGSGEGTECLYTHPSVVAPIIDYCCIASKNKGKIIIGDAPIQECDFDNLIATSGYDILIKKYRDKGISIKLVDFRELISVVENGVHKSRINCNSKGTVIDLGDNSEFGGISLNESKKLRITNYNPLILTEHHTDKKHEYYVSDYVLKADVVINMPKPKCHRKAGATISLKNSVGINVRKEYLPHHTQGSVSEGGDEYLIKNFFHSAISRMVDLKNYLEANKMYFIAKTMWLPIRICYLFMDLKRNSISEGSWYGNNTICKTISDLNKILVYADQDGVMHDSPQRKIFICADMVVAGEKDGPICPSPKTVGIIASGFNPVDFDKVIATLMGFDYRKIPSIVQASRVNGKYKLSDDDNEIEIVSNELQFNQKKIDQISVNDTLNFIPTDGWKNHIEL